MRNGFPKQITTEKLGRSHYRITRDDGYSIEIRRSIKGDWYQAGNMTRQPSLKTFQMNMKYGYMPHDQLGV